MEALYSHNFRDDNTIKLASKPEKINMEALYLYDVRDYNSMKMARIQRKVLSLHDFRHDDHKIKMARMHEKI